MTSQQNKPQYKKNKINCMSMKENSQQENKS